MNNAIYIALSRQTGLFRNMDVVANNVANASTPGFKGETMVFEQYLTNDKDNFRKKIAFANDVATYTDFRNGAAVPTGRDLDVALEGEGFFKVQTPQGIRYTRRGSFRLDAESKVVTPEGYAVLDNQNQPIQLQENDNTITIDSTGTLSVGQNGEPNSPPVPRGEIAVVRFANPQKLQHLDNGLYTAPAGEVALPDEGKTRLIHGSLEQSNISPVTELTNMIQVNRSVGSVTGFMSDMHELTRRAITAYTRSQ